MHHLKHSTLTHDLRDARLLAVFLFLMAAHSTVRPPPAGTLHPRCTCPTPQSPVFCTSCPKQGGRNLSTQHCPRFLIRRMATMQEKPQKPIYKTKKKTTLQLITCQRCKTAFSKPFANLHLKCLICIKLSCESPSQPLAECTLPQKVS